MGERSKEPILWNGLHDPQLKPEQADIAVLGLPFDRAASFRKGAAEGPDRIRSISGHIPPTTEKGASLEHLRVVDTGNLAPGDRSQEDYFAAVEEKAGELFNSCFPTFIGGDHSVAIPLLRAATGIWGDSLGVIHLDAHLDLCDEIDGNCLSHGCTHRRIAEEGKLPFEQVCFVGIRSFEKQELQFLEGRRANIISAAEIYREGLSSTAQKVRRRLEHCRAVYLTLDIDFLDPATAPGTGTPKPGGFTSRELLTLLQDLAGLPLVGMDVVEVSPPLDHNDITSFAAQRAITETWGCFLPVQIL
ncbi:MAG: hypothetical protein AVO34_06425 [Firmicutes bacterium ML8_F2]|jgi:agmatinase|nr:MAG: hypothetical protein AVO34_06425 [Firmicutes bacterium ML8_F2]